MTDLPAPDAPRLPSRAALVASLLALLAGGGLVAALARGQLGPAAFLAGHVLVSASLVAWVVRRRRRADRATWLLAIAFPALGGLAPLMLLIGAPVHALFRATARSLADWHRLLFPERRVDPVAALVDRLDTEADTEAVGFLDVLISGTLDQKMTVLAVLAQRYRPAFAPVLRRALRDPNPSLRVQAATAMNRIERDWQNRRRDLEAAVAADPDHGGAHAALGRHWDDRAHGGLVDAQAAAEARAEARRHYQGALERQPDLPGLRTAIGRLMVRDGAFAEAAAWFEARLGTATTPATLGWYLEALYQLGRHDDLRTVAAAHAATIAEDPALAERLALWGPP